ncbi:HAUS augmin-like complex subunit 6 isoform X1 [Phalacrocorax aristotelis]|uniref:HAUS augmin-like complex subunit 6 isoform X1 n=1 Tax=Phalacrocorax aristotelis TaxID=126867 RepID=UPI003F4C3ECC
MAIEWESKHLRLYLRALGFDRTAGIRGLQPRKDIFRNRSNSGFHAIVLFLFTKLDPSRAAETFRDCHFLVGGFTNPEFRKKCCKWLKEILKEHRGCFPQVTPSALMVPAGPKFIRLLYRFARHVVVENMKINSVGTEIPFAEAVELMPKDMYMANARCRVAYNKLLQILQKEDFVIQEYEKKAQSLIEEINQIQSEYTALQIQFYKMKQNDENKNDRTERIQKVRSMWTCIMEMLTSLQKEKAVVDSVLTVLSSGSRRCILDGTNVVVRVPQLLAHRVESHMHQVCIGNVYEAEKLNFLTVIQLLNEALRILRDEHCQAELKQEIQVTERKIMLHRKALLSLQANRIKIEQQHCVLSESISREQEDWEVKWKSFLGSLSPLNLNLDSELGPSEALQAHCFSLAEEYEDSIFHWPLVSVPDVRDSNHEKCGEKDDGVLETMMDKLMPPPRCPLPLGISSVPLELSKVSENRDMLIEKSLHMQTCKGEKKPVPLKMLKNGKDKPVISKMWENAGGHVTQMEPSAKKDNLLERARDELAEEVAKRVVSESPQSTEGKEMALEDLISSLAFNPFLTRKQIPRTPENLLTEIRSSWRKAIETAGSSDIELAPTEVMVEAPTDAQTIMQKASDSRLVCSIPASAVPDLDPPLSERKSQLSSTEFRLQEQMRIIESPLLETCGMRERGRTEEQELKCIVLNQSLAQDPVVQTLQYVKTNMNTPDICSESNSRTNALPSDHFWGSLKDGILHWNLSSLLSSVSHEAASLGILDETFPEELCSIDPNKSTSMDSDFDVSDSIYVTGASENRSDIKKSNLDLQSLLNRYKMLKKTASRSEEELHQTYDEGESVSCTLDLSLASEKREKDKLSNPPEVFCLDEEFTRSPSPISLNERKYSLSSLLVPYPHLDEAASVVHEIPLSFIHKLKDKELLNENPGGKEPSSG